MPQQEQVPQAAITAVQERRLTQFPTIHPDRIAIINDLTAALPAIREKTLAGVEEALKAKAAECLTWAETGTQALLLKTEAKALREFAATLKEQQVDEEACELREVVERGLKVVADEAAKEPMPGETARLHERCECHNWYFDAPCECGTGKKPDQSPDVPRCGGSGEQVIAAARAWLREEHGDAAPRYAVDDAAFRLFEALRAYDAGCPDCNPSTEEKVAELEATNEEGFDEVLDLHRQLKEMTDARDLCKRQTAQANERLEKTREAWRAEKQRADSLASELDRLRGRADVGEGETPSVAAQPTTGEAPEGGEPSQSVPARWRVGRKLGRTLYAQQGKEPSDGDPFLGLMENPMLAARVVAAVNRSKGIDCNPSTSTDGLDRAVVCFSGGPLDATGGVADLSLAPIHLVLPWEHGSYVFAGTEGDGDGGWLNYEWRSRASDEDFPEGSQALVVLTDPVRELRRRWDKRVRFLLERAEGGTDADAEDLLRLLDGVDHPAEGAPDTQQSPTEEGRG